MLLVQSKYSDGRSAIITATAHKPHPLVTQSSADTMDVGRVTSQPRRDSTTTTRSDGAHGAVDT
jgi:hypothetical protein